MTLVCELPGVIKEIKVKTETLNYGDLWDKTHSHKPSPLPTFGGSVEEKESLKKKRESTHYSNHNIRGSVHYGETTPAGAFKKTKVIVFELPEEPAVEFQKEPIEDVTVEQSGLSKLIGSSGTLDVEVFIPNTKKPIKFKVSPSATFHQLVVAAIKKTNEDGKTVSKMFQDPEAYIVRIATEDGQPDDMFPALAKKGKVERWLNVPFLLLENPNWKPSNADDKIYLRINFPDGSFHTTMVEKTVKVSKVLKNICTKRQLVPSDYILQLANHPDETIHSTTKIVDLKDNMLNLIEKLSNTNDNVYIEGSETSGHKKKKSQVQR